MHGPFGEAHDEEVTENWLARHRRLYYETSKPSRDRNQKKRKKKKKGGRPRRKQQPPAIKIRPDRRRICPSCQEDRLADGIKGGMCLPCQVMAFYRDAKR